MSLHRVWLIIDPEDHEGRVVHKAELVRLRNEHLIRTGDDGRELVTETGAGDTQGGKTAEAAKDKDGAQAKAAAPKTSTPKE